MGRIKNNKCCPRCGSDDVLLQDMLSNSIALYICLDCDKEFETGGHLKKQFEDHRSGMNDDEYDFPLEDSDENEESW